ncbi:MAG: virion core protein, partial [Angelakisella sp.]
ISFVPSKGMELSKYMANILDEEWRSSRGMEIQSVGIANISYDDSSTELINMRNKGAMLSDPTVREGYLQGAVARGMEAAGSNANGAMAGFMGMGVGMQAAGGLLGGASQRNMEQAAAQRAAATPAPATANSWVCSCGTQNTGRFCCDCGTPRPAATEWSCGCGTVNQGKFCMNCGKPRGDFKIVCDKCGFVVDMTGATPKFCPDCGDPITEADRK